MTPTAASQHATSEPVILARLDILSKQLTELDCKLDTMSEKYGDFMVTYTKGHSELEAQIKRVDEKADRAHARIDAINKMVWAIALPVILGALGFLWAVATHAITIANAGP
jgi:hypothetical protein